MNARSQVFEISVEARQVEEAVLSLFHTVLFHRTFGKFNYQEESSYYMGNIGYEDVDCDYIDHTYVRAQSPGLDRTLREEVAAFSNDLRQIEYGSSGVANSNVRSGQVSLEFFQKRPTRWPFTSDSIPWEVWTIRTDLLHFNNEADRVRWQERVGEMLSDKVIYIAEVMNKHDFVPKMPTQGDIELVFDTSYVDVQPYLFKISYSTSGPNSPSVSTAVRRLFKDSLAI
ncbi:ATG101 [Lepeophtheirus salmonis]|uniref:Autophagy-related protein 101 n=1 Tax=Lepeophtheirus salmonis TaxID=72036 RepID=D3PGJ2_LEPSM|nr:Autophagy-related protein 101 [Lepeophtheirus salmonis]ADD38049.1 Autophagy-related protein 101 [Lepeophtheirus salmonis]CAB4056957.1 ATG101 [Lepeophtheirus salmonis]CAF2808214.1 ATG101 [Lepeophtheirus salmonis]